MARKIEKIEALWRDDTNNKSLNIMFFDENTLHVDVWADAKKTPVKGDEVCLARVAINLKEGTVKVERFGRR